MRTLTHFWQSEPTFVLVEPGGCTLSGDRRRGQSGAERSCRREVRHTWQEVIKASTCNRLIANNRPSAFVFWRVPTETVAV
jgi:hypothetical protein